MSKREYREFQESITHKDDPIRRKRVLLFVSAVIIFVVGIGLVLGIDMYRRAEDARVVEEFRQLIEDLELRKIELTEEYENIEYEARKSIGCSAACTLLIDEPRQAVYDVIFSMTKDPAGDGSVRPQTGMIAISPNHMPGKSGNMTVAQFREMLDAGWTYTLRYRGEDYDGPLGEYYDEAWEKLGEIGLEPASSVYFDINVYTLGFDSVLEEKGVKYALHHGEDWVECIESATEGELLHPGTTGWNTIGLNSGLLSQLIYDGGYTLLYMGFEAGYTSFFPHDYTNAVEAFGRMLIAFNGFEQDEEILFFDSPEEAFEHRADYMERFWLKLRKDRPR